MFHRGKLLVFLASSLVILYGVAAAFFGKVVAKDEAYKELSVFMDALRKINEDYVEAPDMSKVQEGAMRGLIDALDPYSSFLTKEQAQMIESRKTSGTATTGMTISKRADVVYVVSVKRNGSADQAGIRVGDYLVAIDGTGIEDKSLLEVDSLLRGAPDSQVKVTVFRNARTKPQEITITRSIDKPVPVRTQLMEGGIGLLDISSLAESMVDEAQVKLKTLISAGAQKFILDLRDCADGEASDAAALANLFLKEGMIYYSQNRQGERIQEVRAVPEKFVTDLPLVILINGSTAGPAEIVAGALKDNRRAIVVGEKSFGVGSAQKRIALKSGAQLVLSIAKFYTPSGKMIQDDSIRNTGIKPDVQAPDEERQQDLLVESYYDEKEDAVKFRELRDKIAKEQLNKAIEVLTKGQAILKRAA
jgi:carboxyl-terminal processing protease